MRVHAIAMLATALAALPAEAAVPFKDFAGKNCKLRSSPATLTCPLLSWSIDSSKYTVTSIIVTGYWSAQATSQRASESSQPSAEFVFGTVSDSLLGAPVSPAPDRTIGYAISDTPAAANSGTFTYSLKTTSDSPRTVTWLDFFTGGGTQSYIKDVNLRAYFTINPPSGAPEPGTWLMLIIGFGFTGAQMRRQRVLPRLGVARS